MNQFIKKLFLISAVLISLSAYAQKNDAIFNTEQVQQAIARGAIVWDVRDEKSFLEGHIPGAINFGDARSVLRDPNDEDYIAILKIRYKNS